MHYSCSTKENINVTPPSIIQLDDEPLAYWSMCVCFLELTNQPVICIILCLFVKKVVGLQGVSMCEVMLEDLCSSINEILRLTITEDTGGNISKC